MTAQQIRGRVVYFGPTGNACVDYLKSISHTQQQHQQQPNAPQQPAKDPSVTTAAAADPGSPAPWKTAAPALPLLSATQQQQLDDGSVVSLNPAEWLVDLFTQADREGRGGDFADVYDASHLKQVRRLVEGKGVT